LLQFTIKLGSSYFKRFTGQKEVEKQSTLLYNINHVLVFYLCACYLAAHCGEINFSLGFRFQLTA